VPSARVLPEGEERGFEDEFDSLKDYVIYDGSLFLRCVIKIILSLKDRCITILLLLLAGQEDPCVRSKKPGQEPGDTFHGQLPFCCQAQGSFPCGMAA
jgi:hypothetical protein